MNRIMEIPGFKGVIVEKMDQLEDRVILHVSLPKKEHTCPNCGEKTKRVHDYRIQKVNHLKWFERLSTIFYKRRRYVCACGKRFSEACPLVDRYQRYSKEWNQVEEKQNSAFIKAIKTFKNWQAEILNSYIFGYSNGFLEGINNTSKVLKRNAYRKR